MLIDVNGLTSITGYENGKTKHAARKMRAQNTCSEMD